ncbi:exodeoxyribonuclease VII large subunit [Aliiglaciecola sp. 3_MG-2023]|uniref:exodeoxyribonuclease VII large subunit n=1 Tax=Aliiglaciecola sp. 3_MG-2023 TaxID=3062644 RepID=UPI0026E29206|nr:exodeoxyribonuclease VII large subunit [Aliiglaciecola sp. 3_MG-2023]MDO6691794.1 exodeoxyribonuclease VII large subunit [Aliiglaciecola sp. 3_MG-2023]
MPNQSSPSKNIFTVSQLNRLARSVLESQIGQVWLSAEISNFVAAASGHWYFTLKDPRAQVKAAMFRGANSRVKVRPKEGDKILVRASVGLYEARGDYQIIVDFMEPEGEGQLKQQFEMLKVKLAAEGLFSTSHKKALPERIQRVGIITSATGAALHDILTVLKRRNPLISVIVYPSQVQGELAPYQLCQAIDKAVQRNEVDVLLIGRGGGSLEDLWCFNDETLARKLFSCVIPTISAVGHEVDVTIADFVADVRAPTPSAAAELVSTDMLDVLQNLQRLKSRLHRSMVSQTQFHRHRSQIASQQLKTLHPENRIKQQAQHLDQMQMALEQRMKRKLDQVANTVNSLSQHLYSRSPINRLERLMENNKSLTMQLKKSTTNLLVNKQLQLAKASELLDSVSPLSTLSRGYSITYKDNEIIKKSSQLKPNDEITTRFHDGSINSKVTGTD